MSFSVKDSVIILNILTVTYTHIAPDKALFFFNQKLSIFFLSPHEKICCSDRCGASNEYPQHIFSWKNKKTIFAILPPFQFYDLMVIRSKWGWNNIMDCHLTYLCCGRT